MGLEIQKMFHRVSDKNKRLFVTIFCCTLLVHMFKIVNYLPNHDSLYYFYGTQDSITSGRWALKYAAGISSYFDIPWIQGILACVYISLSSILIVNIIKINNVFLEFIAALSVGIYPSVISTFAYSYASDAYFLAMLLATLAVGMFFEKDWRKRLVGSLLLGIATGIYQAYLAFAIVLIIICLLKYSLFEKKKIGYSFICCLYSGIIGVLIYVMGLKIRLADRELSNYQGIADASIVKPINEYFDVIKSSVPDLFRLMFSDNVYGNKVIAACVIVLWSIVLLLFGVKCFKEIKNKNYLCVIWAVSLLLLLPIAVYSVKFLSANVVYHKLMVQSVVCIWMLPVVILDNISISKNVISKVCAEILILLLLVNCGNWIIGGNICYVAMHKAYEKSYALTIRIVDRIEQLPKYEETEYLYVAGTEYLRIGETADSNLYLDHNLYDVTHSMTGISASVIQYHNVLYVLMINEYIGGNYKTLYGQNEIEIIKESEEFKKMPIWPQEGSVSVINDIIVVKMADEES